MNPSPTMKVYLQGECAFTQMVWSGTTRIGGCLTWFGNVGFVVMNYWPPGNLAGGYTANVNPPLKAAVGEDSRREKMVAVGEWTKRGGEEITDNHDLIEEVVEKEEEVRREIVIAEAEEDTKTQENLVKKRVTEVEESEKNVEYEGYTKTEADLVFDGSEIFDETEQVENILESPQQEGSTEDSVGKSAAHESGYDEACDQQIETSATDDLKHMLEDNKPPPLQPPSLPPRDNDYDEVFDQSQQPDRSETELQVSEDVKSTIDDTENQSPPVRPPALPKREESQIYDNLPEPQPAPLNADDQESEYMVMGALPTKLHNSKTKSSASESSKSEYMKMDNKKLSGSDSDYVVMQRDTESEYVNIKSPRESTKSVKNEDE